MKSRFFWQCFAILLSFSIAGVSLGQTTENLATTDESAFDFRQIAEAQDVDLLARQAWALERKTEPDRRQPLGLMILRDGKGDNLICGVENDHSLAFCNSFSEPNPEDDVVFYQCTGSHCYCTGFWDCTEMWIFACDSAPNDCIPGKCDKVCDSDKPAGDY